MINLVVIISKETLRFKIIQPRAKDRHKSFISKIRSTMILGIQLAEKTGMFISNLTPIMHSAEKPFLYTDDLPDARNRPPDKTEGASAIAHTTVKISNQ